MRPERAMGRALELAATVRRLTSPNPWVGSVVVSAGGELVGEGATAPPGGPHAEVAALASAGADAAGATLYSVLEPCAHSGRTGPCTKAIVAAGIANVVVSILDPDPLVSGRGLAELEAAGLRVSTGLLGEQSEALLAPYLKHRRTGRPFVVLKLATTADGRIAAPDGSSRWITGEAARAEVHELRAESDAVLVGAGTIRADDPLLTARPEPSRPARPDPSRGDEQADLPARQPLRVVLGRLPHGSRAAPALELDGDLRGVLDELGRRGILQLLVEGGAQVAGSFHRSGLVDRYVLYVAPSFLGGSRGLAMFAGDGAETMSGIWRGRLVEVARVGDDVKLVIEPLGSGPEEVPAAWSRS